MGIVLPAANAHASRTKANMTRAPSARPVQRAAAQSQLPIDVQGDGGAGGDRGGSGVLGFSHSVSSLMLRNRKFPMSATSRLGQSDVTSVSCGAAIISESCGADIIRPSSISASSRWLLHRADATGPSRMPCDPCVPEC